MKIENLKMLYSNVNSFFSMKLGLIFLLLAILFRLSILFWFCSGVKSNEYISGFLGNHLQDTNSYLTPIDNFILNGDYDPHYRMPGYGIWYYLLSLFLPKAYALNGLILLQAICSGIAVYCLSSIGFQLTSRKWVFLSLYFFTLFTTYTSWYDHYLMSESLTVSFLVLLVYAFLKFLDQSQYSKIYLIFSGLLFANLIFLRPVFLPIGGVLFFILLWKFKEDIWKALRLSLVFVLPFLILDIFWIYSGWKKFDRIIPLQESFLGPSQKNVFYEPAFWFVQSWGGNYLWWEPGAPIRYFGVGSDSLELFDKSAIRFPERIFTSKFNMDSLNHVSALLKDLKANQKVISEEEFKKKETLIYNSFTGFIQSIKTEKPFLYHIQSRIFLMDQFFFKTKIRNPFYGHDFPYRDQFIWSKSITYIITLFLGYIASFILFFYAFQKPAYIIITSIVWYTLLIHPIILRVIENRYLLPSYLFLNLAIVLAGFELLNSYKLAKK